MRYIALFGVVAGLLNMFVHYNNDPAFWGWLSATSWAACVFILHLVNDKQFYPPKQRSYGVIPLDKFCRLCYNLTQENNNG